MAQRQHLRLLGGFSFGDGEQHERVLPGKRAFALLACVALERRSRRLALAERLWPGRDVASARRNLRRELVRLKDAGLDAAVEAGPDEIAIGPSVHTDVDAFVAAGERGHCAEALALWGGPLLAGFELADAPDFEAWLELQRAQLARRWRQLALTHAAQLEQAGELREALQWLARPRADDPLQEGHYTSAMRLHHRLGEATAALELYAQCARVLRDELGVAPSAATVALADRVRAAERLAPRLARPPRPGAVELEGPLIGREVQAAVVLESRVPLLLLCGEAGIGKTRLAQECLRAASTLAVHCDAEACHSALYPVAEALLSALRSPQRLERLAAVPAAARREAARLLPSLAAEPAADAPGAAAAEQAIDPGAALRERFFDALADVIDAVAGPGGTLWVDDLHWADEATLELVAHLAHRRAALPDRHVRVVAAARTQELEDHPLAGELARRLERARLLQRLPLAPFEPGQTLALVRALSGTGAGALFAARLQRATQGNPFHLVETLRFLFDSGELRVQSDGTWFTRYDEATADYAELPVPPTVAATVAERVARLSAPARRLVEAAAHARSGFTLAQLQPATALDDWEALDGLEEALRLRLLVEVGGGEGARPAQPAPAPAYRLVHDLAREVLARSVRPERRRLIHERLARVLIEQRESADHIAWHLDEAGRSEEAVPWHLAAAADARAVTSWRGALVHLNLAWAAVGGDTELRLRIVRERVEAARRGFDLGAMAAAVDDLDALARGAGAEAWHLEALVLRAELGQLQKHPEPAIEPLQAVLSDGGFERAAPSLRGRAVAALGNALLATGQLDAAVHVLDAVDADDPAMAPPWRAAVLSARANAARLARQPTRALPLLARAIALLQSPADLEARLNAQNLLAHTLYMDGRPADALATLEHVLDQAEQAQLTVVLRAVLPNLTTLCIVQGELDRARRYLERGMRALRGVDNLAARAALDSRLAELRLTAGELGSALAAARRSILQYEANRGGAQDYAPWVMQAQICWYAGALAEAEAVYGALLQSPARAPGPGPEALVRLKTCAARLPAASATQALEIADQLLRMREAPDAAFAATEADYWRAVALHRAGRHEAAAALAEALPLRELGLHQHEATLLALRLACAASLRRVDPSQLAQAVALHGKAPPLPALELAAALVAAYRAIDAHDEARAWADRQAASVHELARSLADEPVLADGLRARWCP